MIDFVIILLSLIILFLAGSMLTLFIESIVEKNITLIIVTGILTITISLFGIIGLIVGGALA